MIKKISLLLLVAIVASTGSRVHSETTELQHTLCLVRAEFSIVIRFSVNQKTSYAYCHDKTAPHGVITKSHAKGQTLVSLDTYKLNSEQQQRLLAIFNESLHFSLNDQVTGRDGSSWEFKAVHPTRFEILLWSPDYKTKERGLTGLVELRSHMDRLLSLSD